MVETPETIFWVTRKMVSAFKKIFSFAQTMVCGIEKIVYVIHTFFTATLTTVMAPSKVFVLRVDFGSFRTHIDRRRFLGKHNISNNTTFSAPGMSYVNGRSPSSAMTQISGTSGG